jgi:hypothetical protein
MVISSDPTNQAHLEKGPGYVIDTSALIRLDPYYPDIFPSLWQGFEGLITEGRLVAPYEVFIEIGDKHDDPWIRWVKKHKSMFIDKKDLITKAKLIQHWHPGLTKPDDPKTNADYFVIALAQYMGGGWSVVTDEGRRNKQLKIPNVCEKLKIPCLDIYRFFKKCNWKY